MTAGLARDGSSAAPDAVGILGVRVDCVGPDELNAFIHDTIASEHRAVILNVNANCLNLTCAHPWLREMLNEAPVVFCDGTGVQWAARLLGGPVPPRVPYNTWMWQLAPFAAERGYGLYLLGAKPGVAERAAQRLQQHHPSLRVVGVHDGYFDRTAGGADEQAILADINSSGAHILLLGLGMPAQEDWLRRNWPQLRVNIGLTGGASLDYLAGDLATPPAWIARHGFEWVHRLAMEPRRLWRRYLLGNPVFLSRVVRQQLRQRHR